jgi:hypothetical protein
MYLLLEDFKFGLDTRKFFLNSPAGTLTTLTNGHITPGGEIEKRKAFTRQYLPANCYGLVPTEDGLTVFGSVRQSDLTAPSQVATTHRSRANIIVGDVQTDYATLTFASHSFAAGDVVNVTGFSGGGSSFNATGATVLSVTATTITYANTGPASAQVGDTNGRVVLNYTLPSGVVYQRLRHPVDIGETDAQETYAMTEVVHGSVFEGAAFVIAKFGNNGTFAYYDGNLIYDFVAGRATAWMTGNEALANHLADLVNQSAAFSSSSATLVSGSAYKVEITSPSGTATEVTLEEDADAGTLATATTQTQVDGVAGVSPAGQFSIIAGSSGAGNKITAVSVAGQELLPADVSWTTSNAVAAAAVKDAINGRQSAAATVTDRARSSNVATLTVGSHKFIVGDIVVVAGVTNAVSGDYNGTQTLTAVGATTISYANTGTNEAAPGAGPGTATMSTRRYVASVNSNVVELETSAAGDDLNDSVVSVTAAGTVCIDNYSFEITTDRTAGAVPTVDVFINGVSATGGAVAAGTDLADMASDVAAVIVAGGAYAAHSIGNKVYLSRLTTTSSSAPLSVMVVVGAGGGVVTIGAGAVVVSPGPTGLTQFGPSGSYPLGTDSFIGSVSLFASVSGGTPPYSYLWSVPAEADLSANNVQRFTASAASFTNALTEFLPNESAPMPQVKFSRLGNGTTGIREIFPGVVRVRVTDSAGKVASADLPLTAAFYNYNTA